jgi:hypothetical protein
MYCKDWFWFSIADCEYWVHVIEDYTETIVQEKIKKSYYGMYLSREVQKVVVFYNFFF